MELLIIIIFWLATSFIGWLIGRKKGRGLAGFWWSFFLGIIGWIVAACLEPSQEIKNERAMLQARMIKEAMRD